MTARDPAAEARREKVRAIVREVVESRPGGAYVELSGYREDSARHREGAVDVAAPAGPYDRETHDQAIAISERLGPGGAVFVEIPFPESGEKEIWSYSGGRLLRPAYRKPIGEATRVHLHVQLHPGE